MRKSGGMAVFIKDNHFKYFSHVESECEYVFEQARKALFSLYQKIRNLDLPIDCQIKLFDNTILPILTYACDVWGFGDLSVIDKLQTDIFKHILHIKTVHHI